MSEQETLPVGYEFEGYRIEKVAGRGTFGITYLARDIDLDARVAVKEYLPVDSAYRSGGQTVKPRGATQAGTFEDGLKSFLSEAQTLAAMEPHPNIVRIIRFFRAHGTGYIVMEFLPGDLIDEIVASGGRLPTGRLQDILEQLSEALGIVHRLGYLHRDIKPANIRLRANGQPVLIDFGAARQSVQSRSRPLTTILTPGFAPIEQYSQGDEQGPYTDIYALGATAYAALRGGPPPEASLRRRNDPYQPLLPLAESDAERRLFGAIDWAMRYEEADRPQTVEAWRNVLAGGAPAPVSAPPQAEPGPSKPPVDPVGGGTVLMDPGDAARPARPAESEESGRGSGSGRLVLAGVALLALLGTGLALVILPEGQPDDRQQTVSQDEGSAPDADAAITVISARPDQWSPISTRPLKPGAARYALAAEGPFRLRVDGATYLIDPASGPPAAIDLASAQTMPEVKAVGPGPRDVTLIEH